jgi:hypothetical protein
LTKETLEKVGVQIWYEPTFTVTSDSTVPASAKKTITDVTHPDDWTFYATTDKTGKVTGIQKYAAAAKFNGHVESEGWSWQGDVATMGSGSKARLVLACKPSNITITSQKEDGTVKYGTGTLRKIVVHLEVKGKFRYIADSKK